jgi:ACS family tartrate transporter-like MFS transporter
MPAATIMPVSDRARLRVMRRILPYLFVLYIIAFLDRVNVGYAALQMTDALGFSKTIYGFGAGIFFVGYFLLEIPGSLLVEKWSARGWIARIMVTWGVIAVLMGFIGLFSPVNAYADAESQFYVLRFLLGAAEAGFFPGVIVYLSHWFRYEDRAKAVALFMSAIPVSSILGAPVSGYLLGIEWLGLEGWRWLFILEGAPAVVFGVITLFYLTDRPHQAKWLADDERAWIVAELEIERAAKERARTYGVFEALRDPKVLALTAVYFLIVTGGYGFIFWLPTLVKDVTHASDLQVTFICAGAYCVALAAMVTAGWSSDRSGERRLHTALPMVLAGTGFALTAAAGTSAAFVIAALCVTGAGVHAYLPSFWSLPSLFLTGSAAAASVGFINSMGNLGGFLGPFVLGYVVQRTGSSAGGLAFVSALAFAAALTVMLIRIPARAQRAVDGHVAANP